MVGVTALDRKTESKVLVVEITIGCRVCCVCLLVLSHGKVGGFKALAGKLDLQERLPR